MVVLSNAHPHPADAERNKYEFAFHGPAQLFRFIQQNGLLSYNVRTIDVEPLDIIEE